MKRIPSFTEYCVEKRILNEALLNDMYKDGSTSENPYAETGKRPDADAIKHEKTDAILKNFRGLSPVAVLAVLKFSPNWKPDLNTVEVVVDPNGDETNRLNSIEFKDGIAEIKRCRVKKLGGGIELNMPMAKKQQGTVMPIVSRFFKGLPIKIGNGTISCQTDNRKALLNLFYIVKASAAGQRINPKEYTPIERPEDIPEEMRGDIENCIRQSQVVQTFSIQGQLEDVVAAAAEIGLTYQTAHDILRYEVRLTGNTSYITNDMLWLLSKFGTIYSTKCKGENEGDEVGKTAHFLSIINTLRHKGIGLAITNSLTKLHDKVETEVSARAGIKTDDDNDDNDDKFDDDVLEKATAVVDKMVRDGEIEPDKADLQIKITADAMQSRKINDIKRKVAGEVAVELDRQLADLSMTQIRETMASIGDNRVQPINVVDVTPGNAVAKRRLKLFEDAEHYGAQIIRGNGWICALCHTYYQLHSIGGRGRPWMYADGPNRGQIVEKYNKRDDELAELYKSDKDTISRIKRVRDADGQTARGVDGEALSRAPAAIQIHDVCEGRWCISGPGCMSGSPAWITDELGHWNSYAETYCNIPGRRMDGKYFSGDGVPPAMAFMDMTTGRMWLSNIGLGTSSTTQPLGNNWSIKAMMNEDDGSETKLISQFMTQPSFRQILATAINEQAKAWPGKGEFSRPRAALPIPPKDAFVELRDKKRTILDFDALSQNGTMVFRSRSHFTMYKDLVSNIWVRKIKLEFEDASGLFQNTDVSNLQQIDCSMCTNCQNMFANAVLNDGLLDLVSTAKCKNMSGMFAYAKNFKQIAGLDTSSATDISGMFKGCTAKNMRPILLPTLDLRSCTTADDAFLDSMVSQVNLTNCENIEHAFNIIGGCTMLSRMPNLMFGNKRYSLFQMFGVSAHDAMQIFDGCDELVSKNGGVLQKTIDEMKEFYQASTLSIDEKGRVVIASEEDGALYLQQCKEYDGKPLLIRGGADGNADGWLASNPSDSDSRILRVPEVVFENVKSARRLFANCKFVVLGAFKGETQIEHADEMFAGCTLNQFPRMYMKSCKTACNMLAVKNPSEIKHIMDGKHPLVMFNPDTLTSDGANVDDDDTVKNLIFGKTAANGLAATFGAATNSFVKYLRESMAVNYYKQFISDTIDENGVFKFSEEAYAKYLVMKQKLGSKSPKVSAWQAPAPKIMCHTITDYEGAPVDVSGLSSIEDLMEFCTCKNFGGLLNAETVANADGAFSVAHIEWTDGALERTMRQFGSVTNAQGMFMRAVFKGGPYSGEWPFKKLVDGQSMFHESEDVISRVNLREIGLDELVGTDHMFAATTHIAVQCGKRLSLPSARACDGMFINCVFEPAVTDLEVDLPVCANALTMFAQSTGINSILKFSAPKCIDARSMFYNCKSLESVENLRLDDGCMTGSMFEDCVRLSLVMPPPSRGTQMYKNTPLEEVFGSDGQVLAMFRK